MGKWENGDETWAGRTSVGNSELWVSAIPGQPACPSSISNQVCLLEQLPWKAEIFVLKAQPPMPQSYRGLEFLLLSPQPSKRSCGGVRGGPGHRSGLCLQLSQVGSSPSSPTSHYGMRAQGLERELTLDSSSTLSFSQALLCRAQQEQPYRTFLLWGIQGPGYRKSTPWALQERRNLRKYI